MIGFEKIDLLQLDMVNAKTADVEERPRSDFTMKQADSTDSGKTPYNNFVAVLKNFRHHSFVLR